MIQASLQSDHLTSLVEAVRLICELPAVATQDWCDRAAECLGRIRSDTIVCVTLGEIDSRGHVSRLEAIGVSPDGPARETLAARRTLGWAVEEPLGAMGATALLRERQAFGAFAESGAGQKWVGMGVADMMVGLAPVESASGRRRMAIEIGARSGAPTLDRGDLAVLTAAMGELARRARLAFSTGTDDPSQWITPREQVILEQLTLGKTVKQIAEQMARSPHTIHDHVKSLHRKLHVKSRGELIAKTLGHLATRGLGGERAARTETTPEMELARSA